MSSSKSNQDEFDRLFILYVRQMSKRYRLPKEVEAQILRQILKR